MGTQILTYHFPVKLMFMSIQIFIYHFNFLIISFLERNYHNIRICITHLGKLVFHHFS